jgi:asparagine synthase (glutamine-hydrolysing)
MALFIIIRTLGKKLIAKGHAFKSVGDTEVIVRSYIEYGDKCVDHFDGVFSFCIYNSINKNIFLARDRIGIKPLYYSINDNELIFSSCHDWYFKK